MITTVTLNPAIDCILQADHFRVGALNRPASEQLWPGGKGINVSLALHRLGEQTVAAGFSAGASGLALEALLDEAGLPHRFTRLHQGCTRINFKISADGTETECNGPGPAFDDEDLARLAQTLPAGGAEDWLVLSGNVPAASRGAYARLLRLCSDRNMQLVVDTTGDELRTALPFRPFLVKPNLSELAEFCGTEIQSSAALLACARSLQSAGARNVLVSLGGHGACLIPESGQPLYAPAVQGTVVSTIGAGDASVAGFLSSWIREGSAPAALRAAVSAGCATAFCSGIADGAALRAFRDQIAPAPFV